MQPIMWLMWLIIGLLVPAAALTPPNTPNDRRRARLEQRGLSPQPQIKMVAAPPVRAGVIREVPSHARLDAIDAWRQRQPRRTRSSRAV